MTTRQLPDQRQTEGGFDRLLLALDPDRDLAAERYEQLRTRLVKFFEWRGCAIPEELSDRTFDRVGGKLVRGEEIKNVRAYCVGVARMIHLEYLREVARERQIFDDTGEAAVSYDFEAAATEASRVRAFETCFAELLPDQRRYLTIYHTGEKDERIRNRKTLAGELGVAAGSLRIRMFRLRQILEACVERSLRE